MSVIFVSCARFARMLSMTATYSQCVIFVLSGIYFSLFDWSYSPMCSISPFRCVCSVFLNGPIRFYVLDLVQIDLTCSTTFLEFKKLENIRLATCRLTPVKESWLEKKKLPTPDPTTKKNAKTMWCS